MKENYDADLEMSRYIDLELYHEVERSHPFYEEMVGEIMRQMRILSKGKKKLKVLEFGAGTGILTTQLLKIRGLEIDALEIDKECCKALKHHIKHDRCNIIQGDIVTYCKKGHYDLIISSFAHDHIAYKKAHRLIKNIKRNLKAGGHYIMGGEIIPYYSDERTRSEALYKYHTFIVNKALRDKNFRVAQIEINALKSGLEYLGDYKRHVAMFEKEIAKAPLKVRHKKKIGPVDLDDVGGVYVYVLG